VNKPAEVAPPESSPAFVLEIPPDKYRGREYYAARNALQSRAGILKNLRAALNSADGKTIRVTISAE